MKEIEIINHYGYKHQIKKLAEEPDFLYANSFLSDHFWPIIFGQTGLIGTIAFLVVMYWIIRYCMETEKLNVYAYIGVLYALLYLFLISIAETAFHSAIAVPLAIVIGTVLRENDKEIN